MANSLSRDEAFKSIEPLVKGGAALHWLRPQSKAPIAENWSELGRNTLEDLRGNYRSGANVGIRLGEFSKTNLGFIYLIDLDIRDPAMAGDCRDYLRSIWPGFEAFPTVISGSGGESRHFYFITDMPFRSRKLAKSKTFKMVWDETKGREVKKNDWEIELFGTGKQAVIPPSIHPDTGQPYRWETPLDLTMVDLGIGPTVPASLVESWGIKADTGSLEDDEDDGEWLMSEVRKRKLDLEEDDVSRVLRDLPEDWVDDRDEWLRVGQALSHQFEGGEDGYERWCEWSRRSEKFDAKNQLVVWNSFKGSKNPVTMASLIQAANRHRLEGDLSFDEDDFSSQGEFEDLLDLPPEGVALVPVGSDPLLDLLGVDQPAQKDIRVTRRQLEPMDEWRSCMQVNKDGDGYANTMPNTCLVLRNDVRTCGVLGKNLFSEQIVLIQKPGVAKLKKESPKPVVQLSKSIWDVKDEVNGDLWTDDHDVGVRRFIEAPIRQGGYAMKVTDRDLKAAVIEASLENTFHPVQDFLNQIEWDRVPRMTRLFIDYLGCPDTPYHHEAARLFLIGAVARIFIPGCKFDFVPILEGTQGIRKSTFIAVLGGEWTGELAADFHDPNRMIESMEGSWILEMPELQGHSKADGNILKGFISRTHDKRRLAYDKRPRVFPRQQVFIGSTNEDTYLRDNTGGRRFWPIRVNRTEPIDIDTLSRNIQQIWAEAVVMFRALHKEHGDYLPLYMTDPQAIEEARLFQESRRVESAEEMLAGQIEHWLDLPVGADFSDIDGVGPEYRNETCIREIWVECLGRDASLLDQRNAQLVGRALRMLSGWMPDPKPRRHKVHGIQRMFDRIVPK